ncbi:MAG TPA: HAMP domain-containing sensor histidine kinase [Burkholderiales bacterium]|nr:HAMP domain-containing sensor histidine kinase [Burkholderiales bacterium]
MPTVREATQLLQRQLEHLVRLVDDLVDLSRAGLGKIELRRAPVDLREVLRSALETATPVIEAFGHELSLSLPAAPVEIDGDAMRLGQAIANLLNNAAKYSPPAGTISLALAHRGDVAQISVTDNGEGIAPEMLERIFDLFVQGEPSGNRRVNAELQVPGHAEGGLPRLRTARLRVSRVAQDGQQHQQPERAQNDDCHDQQRDEISEVGMLHAVLANVDCGAATLREGRFVACGTPRADQCSGPLPAPDASASACPCRHLTVIRKRPAGMSRWTTGFSDSNSTTSSSPPRMVIWKSALMRVRLRGQG